MDVEEGGGVDLAMEGLAVGDEAPVIGMSGLVAHRNIGAFRQPGARKAVSVIRAFPR